MILEDIKKQANPAKALILQRFFKTAPGEYGAGDKFFGLTVPQSRAIAKKYVSLPLNEVVDLLHSPWHEVRLISLLIMIEKYQRGDKSIVKAYLSNTKFINNWDLVDLSAYKIIGPYLENSDRKLLYKLAQSKSLWERRIAIISTFHFIKKGDFGDTYLLAEKLLSDTEDLMHKAVGWMLREAGKRDLKREMAFIDKHGSKMPRTMLRYAIEKFPEEWRQHYLQKTAKMIK